MKMVISIYSLAKFKRKCFEEEVKLLLWQKSLKRYQFAFSNSFSVFASVYKIKI